MRLIAQAKQGYYPASPEAIAGILWHLKIPDPPPEPKFKPEDVNILDRCAGEAKALVQFAEGLGNWPELGSRLCTWRGRPRRSFAPEEPRLTIKQKE